MNADVEKAVERFIGYMDAVLSEYPRGEADWQTILAALRDQEAEIARHVKVLADCFRMAGADPDGNEDWRIAPDALRAVTDLRRDYDEVMDWQKRAEKAEALLRECLQHHGVMLLSDPPQDAWKYHRMNERITAHLGGEHE